MKKMVMIIVIGTLVFLGICSGAFCARGGVPSGGGHYGGGHYYYGGGPRVFIGGNFGFPYYYPYSYPYYYPYAYPYRYYPDTYTQPPVYIEQEQPSYWYYCKDPQGYYPYVTSCPSGWMPVVPTPPEPGREGVAK
jgi:hypothetical protein